MNNYKNILEVFEKQYGHREYADGLKEKTINLITKLGNRPKLVFTHDVMIAESNDVVILADVCFEYFGTKYKCIIREDSYDLIRVNGDIESVIDLLNLI